MDYLPRVAYDTQMLQLFEPSSRSRHPSASPASHKQIYSPSGMYVVDPVIKAASNARDMSATSVQTITDAQKVGGMRESQPAVEHMNTISTVPSSLFPASVAAMPSGTPDNHIGLPTRVLGPERHKTGHGRQIDDWGSDRSSAFSHTPHKYNDNQRVTPHASPAIQSRHLGTQSVRLRAQPTTTTCLVGPQTSVPASNTAAASEPVLFLCQFCLKNFKHKNDARRHEASTHLQENSWSCDGLRTCEDAFSTTTRGGVVCHECAFCGQIFDAVSTDQHQRLDHLIQQHKFGQCDRRKKFYRADNFEQHLKYGHASARGEWTRVLKRRCVQRETGCNGTRTTPLASNSRPAATTLARNDVDDWV